MKRPIAIAAVLALMLALPLMSQASPPPGSWDVNGTYGIKVTWDQDPAPGTEYPETLVLTEADSGTITGTHLGAPCSPGCADFTVTAGSVASSGITIVAVGKRERGKIDSTAKERRSLVWLGGSAVPPNLPDAGATP